MRYGGKTKNSNILFIYSYRYSTFIQSFISSFIYIEFDFSVQTFKQADLKGDGKIDKEEWIVFAKRSPYLLRNMTLSHLKYVIPIYV
jgi:EF hand